MGKILENNSKKLLQNHGVPTPKNWTVRSGEEARKVAESLGGPVVLKALVPAGKRGKQGAIRFPANLSEVKKQTNELLRMTVGYFPVEGVLVEQRLHIKEEWFLSITLDKQKQLPVIIASLDGGVEVENLAGHQPEKVIFQHVDPCVGLMPYESKQVWARLGLTGKPLIQAAGVLKKLYDLFIRYDAYILEVNPLVLTDENEVIAAASVMGVDEAALYRQPELDGKVVIGSERSWRPLTKLEYEMIKVNDADYRGTARYTEMDGGDIGFMCGGGGGSLLSFDALIRLGGKPANYAETGGNPPEEKVYGLTRGILSKAGVRGLFVAHNITNNTQIDVMARGIVKALQELHIDTKRFPVVVREAGVNDEEGERIFESCGVTYFGEDVTIEQAASKMVERMKEV